MTASASSSHHPTLVHSQKKTNFRRLLTGLSALALLLVLPMASKPARAASPTPEKIIVAQASSSGLGWNALSPGQQQVLQPLAPAWNTLSPGQKRKWLQLSKKHASLSPQEQIKMQGRMRDWAALSPQQRTQARLNFAKTKELSQELTAEEKNAKWQAYQALSAEEKRKLAAKAPRKAKGATAAAKPVEQQNLATVPSRPERKKGKSQTKINPK